MADCRNCKHNSYADSPAITEWVDCCHPITIAKTPRVEPSDPMWVDNMTADMTVSHMLALMRGVKCPAWEPTP